MVIKSRAIYAVQASDMIVFTIQNGAPGFVSSAYSDAGRGPTALSRLTAETGGRFFEVGSELDLEGIFEAINAEVRSQYSLGYTPTRDLALPGFQKIKLTCNRSGHVVRARSGYYSTRNP